MSDTPAPAAAPPAPSLSAFDLLGGSYTKVRRARLVQLVVIGVGLIAIAAVAIQVLMTRLDTAEVDTARTQLEQQLPALRAQLSEEADIGNLTRGRMESHLDRVGGDLVTVLAQDVPYTRLLNLIRSTTPAHLQLTSVTVEGRNVTFQVSAPTYADGQTYATSLDTALSSMVSKVSLDGWTGSSDGVVLTYSATLAPGAVTPRGSQMSTQIGVDLPTAQAGGDTAADGADAPDTSAPETEQGG